MRCELGQPFIKSFHSIIFFFGFISLLLCTAITNYAQDKLISTPNRGFNPADSYSIGDLETVNTTNGNVILHIPLASLPPGRGGSAGFGLQLLYNSKLWDAHAEEVPDRLRPQQRIMEQWLDVSEAGGWRYNTERYTYVLDNRRNHYEQPCALTEPCGIYIYKLMMRFPDGSSHEFRPVGYTDYLGDGYYNVAPAAGMTYFSIDGTFTRLEFDQSGWTIYFPDGARVVNDNGVQRTYDRNDNYIENQSIDNYNGTGHSATKVIDQLGRSITIEHDAAGNQDYVYSSGVGGQLLTTMIKWKVIRVYKTYQAARGTSYPRSFDGRALKVVDQIILPVQAGDQRYTFGYNAGTTNPSVGWGEISSITMPSGARADYQYMLDGEGPYDNAVTSQSLSWKDVLNNCIKQKDLTYLREYDGTSTQATDTWKYDIRDSAATITAPDGGITNQFFGDTQSQSWNWNSGLVYKTVRPDGSVVESKWEQNRPGIEGIPSSVGVNTYVKTEYISIPNAAGTLVKTAIKDYSYDKNGNILRVSEYDWVDYGSVPRDVGGNPTGIPGNAVLKRQTVNDYYISTPDASVTGQASGTYHYRGTARLLRAVKSSEVVIGEQKLARTEYVYDDASARGNLTEQKRWDSTKGTYSNPLSTANSISVSYQYDVYGNPTLSTDARGFQTQFTYGSIGGFTDLYPTLTITAFGTSIQRTARQEYDFNTGLVTRATDVDNNVSTSTSYDVFGRPTLVRNAEGKAEEARTVMEYSDLERRVIVRKDLNTLGDGKLVSIQHYDQLGRIRLTRQLEDSTTQSATDETAGIKVQTRYLIDSTNHVSYQLVSNPYRAATSGAAGGEATMGWSRSKSDSGGRVIEVGSFSGSSLPAPWAGNANSTGVVTTAYDADQTTVIDQAGKTRRSVVNALGELIRVDEPDASNNLTQSTSYTYDVLGNLTQVIQGSQTRTFSYSSLSRLTSATNPESGTISYQYDNNGNLTQKVDARLVESGNHLITSSNYDALNRLISRSYNDGTAALNYSDRTPTVTYTYDTLMNGKGRLTSISSSVSTTSYGEYDAMGRVKQSSQTTDGRTYQMSYGYNLAGAMISETYPSGRTVTTSYDNAGRISSVGGQKTGEANKTYASQLSYAASGSLTDLKLGNNLWEHTLFNTRLQPIEIGLGTTQSGIDRLKLNYSYGTTNNNGNVQSQTITVPTIGAATGYSVTQSYTYDELDRLKSATEMSGGSQSWKQTFLYDRYGNRTFDTRPDKTSPGMVSSLLTIDSNTNKYVIPQGSLHYDSAGNLDVDYNGHTFSYDGENRQTKYENGATVSGGADYAYDGDGRRVKKMTGVSLNTTIFVYDVAGQMVAEYTTASPSGNNGTSYLTADNLGTPRIITDASGNVRSRHDYAPFGEELGYNSSLNLRSPQQGYAQDNIKQKFTRKERDVETGLDYFGARYYASAQGRFTSPDEFKGGPEELFGEVDPHDPLFYSDIADPQSLNKYQYCLNNPLRYIDPDGHQETKSDALTYAVKVFNAVGVVSSVVTNMPSVRSELRRTVNGAASALSEDNGLGPIDAPQNSLGRGIGHTLALGQAVGEIVAGTAMMASGGAMVVTTDGALAAPGTAVAQTGAVVATHGVAVGVNTLHNIFSNDSSSGQGGNAPRENEAPHPNKDRTVEGARVQRENIEQAQKVHRNAGRPDRIRSIEKSKQNERQALKKIKTLKDVEEN